MYNLGILMVSFPIIIVVVIALKGKCTGDLSSANFSSHFCHSAAYCYYIKCVYLPVLYIYKEPGAFVVRGMPAFFYSCEKASRA